MSSPIEVSPRPIAAVVAVLMIVEAVSVFEATAVFNAIPQFIMAFHSNAADVSWTVTAFTLVAVTSAAVCGRLGDIYGRRKLIIIVLLLSLLGSVVSLATGTLGGVIIGRALQGTAGAVFPLCYGLVRELMPPKKIPVVGAIVSSTALVAGAAGSLVSGVLLDAGGWRYIFAVTATIAALAAVACLYLRPSAVTDQVHKIDYLGGLLFAPGVALVLYGITQSKDWGWSDSRLQALIAAGLVVIAVWVWWELRVETPMIDIRMLTGRELALTNLATAVVLGPLGITGGLVFPLIIQTPHSAPVGLGLSATAAGWMAFTANGLSFGLSPISGQISAAAGPRRSLMIGTVIGVVGIVMLWQLYHSWPGLIVSMLVLGISTAFLVTALPNLVINAVATERTSEALGVNYVAQMTAAGIATSVAALLMASDTVPGTPFSTDAAYHKVFLLLGICMAAGFVIALSIRSRGPRDALSEPIGAVAVD